MFSPDRWVWSQQGKSQRLPRWSSSPPTFPAGKGHLQSFIMKQHRHFDCGWIKKFWNSSILHSSNLDSVTVFLFAFKLLIWQIQSETRTKELWLWDELACLIKLSPWTHHNFLIWHSPEQVGSKSSSDTTWPRWYIMEIWKNSPGPLQASAPYPCSKLKD